MQEFRVAVIDQCKNVNMHATFQTKSICYFRTKAQTPVLYLVICDVSQPCHMEKFKSLH
jgi:hypothetical protein